MAHSTCCSHTALKLFHNGSSASKFIKSYLVLVVLCTGLVASVRFVLLSSGVRNTPTAGLLRADVRAFLSKATQHNESLKCTGMARIKDPMDRFVGQLQEGSDGGLRTSAKNQPASSDETSTDTLALGQSDLQPAESQPAGIICTMVKDEFKHLAEWIEFHLLVGATNIVIYDDNSTTSAADYVKPFGDAVVVHQVQQLRDLPQELLISESEQPKRLNKLHKAKKERQLFAISHCASTYGARHGWLAVIDVDEYILPCSRSSKHNVWNAFNEHVFDGNMSKPLAKVECLKFGFNDLNRTLVTGELLLEHQTYRAPYHHLEPHLQYWAMQNMTNCNTKKLCISTGAQKFVYNGSIASSAQPRIHGPKNEAYDNQVKNNWSRRAGLCCNHYIFKSPEELVEKYLKSGTIQYAKMARPDGVRWFTSVPDTLIWQYLPDFKEAVARRGMVPVQRR